MKLNDVSNIIIIVLIIILGYIVFKKETRPNLTEMELRLSNLEKQVEDLNIQPLDIKTTLKELKIEEKTIIRNYHKYYTFADTVKSSTELADSIRLILNRLFRQE